MEKTTSETTENVTGKLSEKSKVLSIADPGEGCIPKTERCRDRGKHVEADFRSHLSFLLLGTRSEIEVVENWDLLTKFEMASTKKDNQPRKYIFSNGKEWLEDGIISGSTICGEEVLNEVHKRLSGENWISKNEIETPLRTKVGKEYYNSDCYMQHIVNESLDAQRSRLIKYILDLHREYVRNNRN